MQDALLHPNWPGAFVMDDAELENVMQVVKSRSPFRFYGEHMLHFADQLEAAYRERLGRRYALAVSSCTAALSVAMNTFEIGPGDEVLLPAFMYVACVGAVVRAGAIPRFVEVDQTFGMDPDDLERKIGPQTRMVMMVHMAGTCGRLDQLLAIARKHNLIVLEDVAQSNGASYKGRPLGSFGDMAVFSFQLNKNATSGEGGMVVCDDERLYHRAYAAHDHGYPRAESGRHHMDAENPALPAPMWGQGSRMSELCAAMMVAQEQKLDTITSRMRYFNHRFYEGLEGLAGAQSRHVVDPEGDSGNTVIMTWPTADICRKMVEATREAGVRDTYFGGSNNILNQWGIHIYYGNLSLVQKRGINRTGRPWTDPLNQFAADYSYARGALPQSDDLFDRSSTLLLTPAMTDELCDRVIDIFRQCALRL